MNRSCDICGTETSTIVQINNGYAAAFCESCDLLSTITDIDEGSRDQVNKDFYPLEERLFVYYPRFRELRRRYEKIFEWIKIKSALREKIGVLEVGNNIGHFSIFVKESGCKVDGVEINPQLRAFQELVYGLTPLSSLEELNEGDKYDLIVLMDVLEHIPDPKKILNMLKLHLEKGGVIFLQFPNKNSLSARLLGKRWYWWLAPDHLYHFTDKAVLSLARETNLEVIALRKVSPLLETLVGIPIFGNLFKPLIPFGEKIPLNILFPHPGGSILQVLLRAHS